MKSQKYNNDILTHLFQDQDGGGVAKIQELFFLRMIYKFKENSSPYIFLHGFIAYKA